MTKRTHHAPAGGQSIQAVIHLLKDPQFCAEAQRVIDKAAGLRALNPSPAEWRRSTKKLVQPFLTHWQVVPPTTGEFLDADPRRRLVHTIVSGRWGLVLLFPWTTDYDFKKVVTRIRFGGS